MNNRYYDPIVCRFISPDNLENIDPIKLNGLNLFIYCVNNPVMNVDPTGCAWFEFWKWNWAKIGLFAVSILEIAGGLTLLLTGLGGTISAILIGAGIGSLIIGFINEAGGGSFVAGWVGGEVGGIITAKLFTSFLAFGSAIGAFVGSSITDCIDKGCKGIDWGKAGLSALLAGFLDIMPSIPKIIIEDFDKNIIMQLTFSFSSRGNKRNI